MVPKIASFLGTTQTEGNVMFAVSAVVSATAPLFILVMFLPASDRFRPDAGCSERLINMTVQIGDIS